MLISKEDLMALADLAMNYRTLRELREANPEEAKLLLSYAHDKSENWPTMWLLKICAVEQAGSPRSLDE